MLLAAIGELGIDLIGQHQDIGIPQHFRNGFKILPLHNAAGGVVGIGEDQQLALGRNSCLECLGSEAEIVLEPGGNAYNLRSGQAGNGIIGYIAGLGDQDFIAGIDHRADHHIDGLRTADGDHGLLFGIGKPHAALEIAVDLLLEFPETGVG